MENLLFGLLTGDKIALHDMAAHEDVCSEEEKSLHREKLKTGSLNAVVYTRFTSQRNKERFLDYEREKGMQYCDLQEYRALAVAESVDDGNIRKDEAVKKILELAETGLIDVVVLTSVGGFTGHPEDTYWLFDRLYEHGVKVDWVGYGDLDKAVFRAYIEADKKQMQVFEDMLNGFVSQNSSGERSSI